MHINCYFIILLEMRCWVFQGPNWTKNFMIWCNFCDNYSVLSQRSQIITDQAVPMDLNNAKPFSLLVHQKAVVVQGGIWGTVCAGWLGFSSIQISEVNEINLHSGRSWENRKIIFNCYLAEFQDTSQYLEHFTKWKMFFYCHLNFILILVPLHQI